MKDYMMALHQRSCKEPECREVRKQLVEVERELYQALDRRGQEQLLKLADLENELKRKSLWRVSFLDLNWRWELQRSWVPPTPSTMTRSNGFVRLSSERGASNGKETSQRQGKHP